MHDTCTEGVHASALPWPEPGMPLRMHACAVPAMLHKPANTSAWPAAASWCASAAMLSLLAGAASMHAHTACLGQGWRAVFRGASRPALIAFLLPTPM